MDPLQRGIQSIGQSVSSAAGKIGDGLGRMKEGLHRVSRNDIKTPGALLKTVRDLCKDTFTSDEAFFKKYAEQRTNLSKQEPTQESSVEQRGHTVSRSMSNRVSTAVNTLRSTRFGSQETPPAEEPEPASSPAVSSHDEIVPTDVADTTSRTSNSGNLYRDYLNGLVNEGKITEDKANALFEALTAARGSMPKEQRPVLTQETIKKQVDDIINQTTLGRQIRIKKKST